MFFIGFLIFIAGVIFIYKMTRISSDYPTTNKTECSCCECDCHRDGETLFEFFPCCQLHLKKYITIKGVVDQKRLDILLKPKPRKKK